MTSRPAPMILVAVALASILAGCAPASEPSPTSTSAFADEAEAFAAAEETYRAYVDALNAVREDPTASDPQDFLIGEALEIDIDTQQQLDQADLVIVGSTSVVDVEGLETSPDLTQVQIAVCMDSTDTRVIDGAGKDVTPQDRPAQTRVRVQLERFDNGLVISESDLMDEDSC
ncbi:hypothetical protein [Microbacterium gallinarum]|uniref:Lipoprotein n=1 Tax=Microbacterium gallinarum TaxID=2762209 RepID=A0ABR8X3R7_9MICO|nr:hypothetical protein [Microbacterium gallinarum]MBD8023955.1 hypothetical protein [Microbacterium gallinarum]